MKYISRYAWTYTTVRISIFLEARTPTYLDRQPNRDGASENEIFVLEMTHGITNRMTGGGTGRCLQTTEADGMGGGWSDAMAEYVFDTCFLRLYIDFLIR